jgi:hypothetical protein
MARRAKSPYSELIPAIDGLVPRACRLCRDAAYHADTKMRHGARRSQRFCGFVPVNDELVPGSSANAALRGAYG